MSIRRYLFISAFIIFSNSLNARRIIIYCGKLIDTKSLQVLSEMTIIVQGKTISNIQKGYRVPATSDQVIDLKAGVKIAFRTDAGVYAHGKNWLEMQYMNQAGMPPLEVLRSATWNAYELIGISDKAGSI